METQNRRPFGSMPDGTLVEELTLRDGACACSVLTYGGAVRTLTVPGRNGGQVDVVLGYDTLEDYRKQDKYLGALVGRYANRIGGARFELDGTKYTLAANDNGVNHLHGGLAGFDKKVWTVEQLTENAVSLSLVSPDGEEGYPGTLAVKVVYTLQNGRLEIAYEAVTDKTTVCNLTNHTYFNLSGHDSGPVANQVIQILAERYTPTLPGSIPTGALADVAGTPMDLREFTPIGAHIDEAFEQLQLAGGYDHNWAADGWDGALRTIARAWSPDTGISLAVETTLPGVQFYAGNYLDGRIKGKNGAPNNRRWGFCLETQFFPDSPNHDNFPSCVLRPGQVFRAVTAYRFGVEAEQPKKGQNKD